MRKLLRRLQILWYRAEISALKEKLEYAKYDLVSLQAEMLKAKIKLRQMNSKLAVLTPADELLDEALSAPRTRI